jgi:hypothetical protein
MDHVKLTVSATPSRSQMTDAPLPLPLPLRDDSAQRRFEQALHSPLLPTLHQPPPKQASGPDAKTELADMLERLCSAMYVGERSSNRDRVIVALDHVIPGAAAEIVRDGMHLTIRLHARTDASHRIMSSRRDDGHRRVDITVVQAAGRGDLGEAHG